MSLNLYVGPDSQPDKYRLVRSVGRGGEATLYLAEVTLAGQTEPVVVKVLNSDVTANDEQFAELSAKWGEQAELLRFINRLGVVGVREHFEGAPEHPAEGAVETADQGDERALYLVMNYVEGLDLRDWRAENAVEGPRGQRQVLQYLEQTAQVLDVLHSGRATPSKRVVVHGDLSPGNVMISDEGQATLVDFGLSRIAARHMTARPWFTPGYAAPEIFNGEYSPATDRYAFGAIAFFALTGEDPPPAPEQLRERLGALPLLAQAGETQRELVMRMFSAEPSERPEASEWIRVLRSLATSAPWTGPSSEPVGPGGAVAAAAVMGTATDAFPEPSAAAEAGGSDTPPQGARVSGPPPVSGPAEESAASAAPAPAAASDADRPVDDMSQRPVGGMRGAPAPQSPEPAGPRPESAPPRPNTPPPGAPVPNPGAPNVGAPAPNVGSPNPGAPSSGPSNTGAQASGAQGPGRPPAGPPQGAPRPGGPISGGPPRNVPPHNGPMRGGPAPAAPMHSGPAANGPVSSGPIASGSVPGGPTPTGSMYGGPHATGAYTVEQPAPPPVEASTGKPKRKSRKPLMIGMAIFAVLFMVIGAGGTYLVMDRVIPVLTDSDDAVELADAAHSPVPSDEPSPTDEPAAAATDLPTEDPSEDPSADPSEGVEAGSTLLTQMESVDSSRSSYWRPKTGRADIDGQAYSRAIISGFCKDHSSECSGWEDYNLSRDWSTFTATIGVEDSSKASATTTFTVHVDGEKKVTETLRLGEVKEIEVSVEDALRLRIEVKSDSSGIYPVWADPTLTSD